MCQCERAAHSTSHRRSLLGLKCDGLDLLLGFLLAHSRQLPVAGGRSHVGGAGCIPAPDSLLVVKAAKLPLGLALFSCSGMFEP